MICPEDTKRPSVADAAVVEVVVVTGRTRFPSALLLAVDERDLRSRALEAASRRIMCGALAMMTTNDHHLTDKYNVKAKVSMVLVLSYNYY